MTFAPLMLGLSLYVGTPTLPDLEFTMAVEQSVMAMSPGSKPPSPFKGLIERMGGQCWHCREIATRKLARLSLFDHRWLFWGRKHRDPEIRARSNGTLRRLYACRTCKGHGEVENKYWWTEGGDRVNTCRDCGGVGQVWPYSLWY